MVINQDCYEDEEKHDFMKNLLPRVFRSEGDWVKFDPSKIYQSIIKETGLDNTSAEKITEIVVRRIISSGIKFLSGPHIREIVCSVLSEQHFEEERKLYTRIGMPLMDYEEILNFGVNENANQDMNPESIHHWAANRISEEYALLRILNSEEAHAHLYGDIHIHMLRYFDLRPFCQAWDARMILEHGLPPVSNWPHCSRSGPAGSLRVAVTHLAKWLGIIQGEFSLPYDETVLIEENNILSWRKIGDVVEENLDDLKTIYTFAFNPKTLKMEKQRITNVFKHNCNESFLKINLEYGREITVTRHHSLFTLNDGRIIPVKGKELKVGDYVVVPRKINYKKEIKSLNILKIILESSEKYPNWYVRSVIKNLSQEEIKKLRKIDKWANQHIFNDSIPLEIFKKLNISESKWKNLKIGMARSPYELPAVIELSKELLFILGVYVAEGSACYKHFNITLDKHEKSLIKEVKEKFYSTFKVYLKDRNPHSTVNQLSLESEVYRILFEDLFKIGHKASNKKAPFFIFGLNEKYIKSFLRGFFLRDGHCRNSNPKKKRIRNEIFGSTISNQLIKDLNFLLLRLGIVPSISYGKNINRISIYGQHNLSLFLDNFKDSDLKWNYEDTSCEKSPIPLLLPINHLGLRSRYGNSSNLNYIERAILNQKERIGRNNLYSILAKLEDSPYKKRLEKFINSDLCVLRINTIKKLPKEEFAFDFEVSPNGEFIENFIAGKGLIIAHNSGGQGYDYITTFLAPFAKGLSEREIEQSMQCLIFETNQIFAARGGQVPFTSISCTPTVPKGLTDIPAIGPKGKIVGSYGDYKDECLRLFDALTDVYIEGDHNGKLFGFPKHEVKMKKEWLKEFEPSYLKVMKEAVEMGTPYFLNMCPDWMPDEIHSQCCRKFLRGDEIVSKCILDPEKRKKGSIWEDYVTIGSLQSVSLNLPRYAYMADNEDQYFEILDEKLELCSRILIKKWYLMEKRLQTRHLPLCSGTIDGKSIFRIEDQNLSIGFTGLNEAVQSLTNMELHEDENAFELGKRILNYMVAKCNTMSERSGFSYSLWEQPAESSSGRFAKLDLKHFPKKAIPQSSGESAYYTNSSHFRYDAEMPLYERIHKQGDYHPIVGGGVISHIWLGEQKPDINGLWELTKNICLNTNTAYFAYTTDFTYCPQCQKMFRGGQWTCPKCHSEDVKVYSRITGYYSEVNRYNDGKRAEWESRKRENVI
ncbi:MAG: putative Ribonucleoside-triphosphate reductase [Promethearchaeota archaeon]|nr:MAG: putative Ribonucleoside-triphosphate reductase [Candidatus Lokiarchaeota archaeon]